MDIVLILVATAAGTVISGFLACLPGLHVYNVMGLVVLLLHSVQQVTGPVPPVVLISAAMGMVVGYSVINTIPSIFLGAPDESALFMVFPGQKYLMQRRGYEAAAISTMGALGALAVLGIFCWWGAPRILPPLRRLLSPHMYWILGTILAYMVMSEWPKGGDVGRTGWQRFFDGWKSVAAGYATLLLSGFLGFILIYRSPIDPRIAFQNIMPAFVGLFAVPWTLTNLLSGTQIPEQHVSASVDLPTRQLARGVASGFLGGMFAAFFPIVTGGIGGLLAGHATAQRDTRAFIVSQGASKTVYYVGAFLLAFVPGLSLTRGGMAWMLRTLYVPRTMGDFYVALAAMFLAGAISCPLMLWLSRRTIGVLGRFDYRWASVATLAIIVAIVAGLTGWPGMFIMIVASGIGLIPVFFHSRRMNCMGVLLIPIMCNMAGFGPAIARILGLT